MTAALVALAIVDYLLCLLCIVLVMVLFRSWRERDNESDATTTYYYRVYDEGVALDDEMGTSEHWWLP